MAVVHLGAFQWDAELQSETCQRLFGFEIVDERVDDLEGAGVLEDVDANVEWEMLLA